MARSATRRGRATCELACARPVPVRTEHWNQNSPRCQPAVLRSPTDILAHQEKLTELYTERDTLDRNRQTLAWPERSRRYQVNEEIARVEGELRAVLVELDGLGLTLLNPAEG